MQSQAETAGRLSSSSSPHPQKGTVLRDLELCLADGTRRLLSSIRGNSNLVMLFTGGRDLRGLLTGLASVHQALKDYSTRVLVISPENGNAAENLALNPNQFVLSIDFTGTAHFVLGATGAKQTPAPAVYITDRFGEVFAAFRATDPAELPSPQEIICWLEFINYQCEECSPSEWQE